MLVLNDIELVKFLRPLGLLKNGEFLISNIFMTKNYLEAVERQTIKVLADEELIVLFELGEDFYNFFSKFKNENFPIGLAGMSSIHHSIVTKFPLVTKCETVKKFAKEQGVLVYTFDEALRLINSADDKIEMIKRLIKM